jgi:hypothetical protein
MNNDTQITQQDSKREQLMTEMVADQPAHISNVKQASILLLKRYMTMMWNNQDWGGRPHETDRTHLLWMCQTALDHASSWPTDKLSRWLGFVQGILIVYGITDVKAERDFSRPLFHDAYRQEGHAPPVSLNP